MADLPAPLERALLAHLPNLDTHRPLDPDEDLVVLGLDSMGVVELLFELEEEYGIVFDDDLLTPDHWATPRSIVATVQVARDRV